MTVKKLLNSCQNKLSGIVIFRITSTMYGAYDPEEDTEEVGAYTGIVQIEPEILNSEVQDFYIDGVIYIYI